MRVNGHCPACAEKDCLSLGEDGNVTCEREECDRPQALQGILDNVLDHVHVVQLSEDGFMASHPISERFDGSLMDCPLSRHMRTLDAPPAKPGAYLARPDAAGEWSFVPLPTGA